LGLTSTFICSVGNENKLNNLLHPVVEAFSRYDLCN